MARELTFNMFRHGEMDTFSVTLYSQYLKVMEKIFGEWEVTDTEGLIHEHVMDAAEFFLFYGEEFEDPDTRPVPKVMCCPACHRKGGMEFFAVSHRPNTKRNMSGAKLYAASVYKCSFCGCCSALPDTKRESAMSQFTKCSEDKNVVVDKKARNNLRNYDKVAAGHIYPLLCGLERLL